jgi:hypothetical protein
MTFLPEGVFTTQVTMKSPTGNANVKASVGATDVRVLENKIGKVIARKPLLEALSLGSEHVTTAAPVGTSRPPATENLNTFQAVKESLSTESNLGAPMQDHVSLDLVDQASSLKVDITVSCELMHNSKIAMPRESERLSDNVLNTDTVRIVQLPEETP